MTSTTYADDSQKSDPQRSEARAILEEILDLEGNAFVRYVIEVSKPPLVKAEDYKALACFQDLYRESSRGLHAIARLFAGGADDEIVTRRSHWPLEYTNYNFLRPVFLLRPVLEHVERHIARVEALNRELTAYDWPEAVETVRELVARESEYLSRVKRLAEDHVDGSESAAAKAPPPKGTSASRW